MAPERVRYRKLPGHRRGILRGSSLWLGSDHLLSVKSLRFREEYKRFHLRDVEAIIVARAPRFHLSTRAIGIALLWLAVNVSTGSVWLGLGWASTALRSAAVALVFAWVYVSSARSCRCRIYTAVSSDDLPSIYRTWTARKFLAEVEPRIAQVQGVLEGNWAEAIENRDIGPSTTPAMPATPAAPGTTPPLPGSYGPILSLPAARSRTMASDIFVASLFADALLNYFTLHSLTRTVQWIWYGLAFVQVGGAVLIFLQHHRGILKAGMQKLAIATLIVMGGAYYLRQVMAGISNATRAALPDPSVLASMPGYILIREVHAALCLVLGVVGIAVALMASDDVEQPRSITG